MEQHPQLLVYKASAGSGKTFTLAVHYIRQLIEDPYAYRRILAVTFTNKATAEMKERILEQLYGIATADEGSEGYLKEIQKTSTKSVEEIRESAREALRHIIHDYSRFRIETIDSFFQSVMRNLARELELGANLSIELNNTEVLSDAVDAMIEKLDRRSPVLYWLLEYIEERIVNDRRWDVSKDIKGFGQNIFDESYIEKGEGLRRKLADPNFIPSYRDELKSIREEVLEFMKGFSEQFTGLLEMHGLTPTDLKNGSRGIGSYFNKLANGKLSDDIRNATVEKCLESEENWTTKTSAHRDEIRSLAASELIPLLAEAENRRPQNNLLLNSCDLSLRYLNNLRLLAHIDEEVRLQNQAHNRFLLSDTNALLHSLIREGDASFVYEKIGTTIDTVMIDEFQDINRLQYEIIKMLAAPQNNLFIVGDDDQSIYRFRGSKPEIMLGFEKDYPNAKRILLDTNYRCCRYIVEASLNLISHNRERFDKKIIAASKSKAPVTFADFENRRDENIFLIRDIDKKIKAGAVFSDFAVLFRTNTQPRQLIEQLMSYNIPFKTKDNIPNIYEHWIARDLFTYQRIAGGSRDRADFLQIMNRPKRYLSRDSLCDATVAFDEWIKLFDEKPWIAERIEKLEYDMKLISRMNPYASINYIRRGIGYDDFLVEYAEYRNINKEDLFDILDEIQSGAKGFATYEEWYEHIREYTKQMKLMALSKESDPNAVTLATLHSSKGLEFENVYIIDANEGIMPYKKAVLEKDIEEERRLFYVGMTRAKTSLSVYSVKSVNDKSAQASRFVRESKEPRQNNSRDD